MMRRLDVAALLLVVSTLSGCHLFGSDRTSEVLKRPSPAIPAYSYPVWSPDGLYVGFYHRPLRAIRYDAQTKQYVYEFDDSLAGFWIISSGGGSMKRLGPPMTSPAWTRDGAWIAYSDGQVWKTSVMSDTLLGASVQVTADPNGALFPAWSPDGNHLIYCITSGPSAGLKVCNADGTGTRAIGMHGWIFPHWNTNGDRIVFLGQVGATYGIATCDTLGQDARSLGFDGEFPAWSPDGTKVAYVPSPRTPRPDRPTCGLPIQVAPPPGNSHSMESVPATLPGAPTELGLSTFGRSQ